MKLNDASLEGESEQAVTMAMATEAMVVVLSKSSSGGGFIGWDGGKRR